MKLISMKSRFLSHSHYALIKKKLSLQWLGEFRTVLENEKTLVRQS